MYKDLVSVIVPVYNMENYLEKCVDSIREQTYKELEIILVDDGSTDASPGICDKFAQMDVRISVIHKKNGGLVSARKAGIRKASGEYTITIDSDDWIEKNTIEELNKKAIKSNAEIVTSGYVKEYRNTNNKVTDAIKEGVYGGIEGKRYIQCHLIFDKTVEKYGIWPYLCGKLIKTSLLQQVYLKLDDRITHAEDAATVFSCCVLAEKIVVTHEMYYHYVMRADSIVHSKSIFFFQSINLVYIFLMDFFKNSTNSVQLLEQLELYIIKLAFSGINYTFGRKCGISIPYYDFPKNEIPMHTRLVLYGAGRVGQSYYKQICTEKLYSLVGWVDIEFQKYQNQGMDVMSLEKLEDLNFDYILIALKYGDLVEKVKADLKDGFGIEESKLLWFEPISMIDKYNV